MSISGFFQGLDQGIRQTTAYATGAAFGAANGAYKLVRGTVSGVQEGADLGGQIGSELGSIAYRAFSAFSTASFSFLALNQTVMSTQASLSAAFVLGTINFALIDDSLAKRTAELAGALVGAVIKGVQRGGEQGYAGFKEGFGLGSRVGKNGYAALGFVGASIGKGIDYSIDQFMGTIGRIGQAATGGVSQSPAERKTFVCESIGRLISVGVTAYLMAPYILAAVAMVYSFDPQAELF